MLDRTEHERWWEAAADARRAADVQHASGLHNWSCFLAEQATQLAVKALLHGIGSGARGHDLVALGARVQESVGEQLPDAVLAALRRLSRHYIPARYPDAHPGGSPLAHYGSDDAEEAISDADTVTTYVDDLWRKLLAAEAEGGRASGEAGSDGG